MAAPAPCRRAHPPPALATAAPWRPRRCGGVAGAPRVGVAPLVPRPSRRGPPPPTGAAAPGPPPPAARRRGVAAGRGSPTGGRGVGAAPAAGVAVYRAAHRVCARGGGGGGGRVGRLRPSRACLDQGQTVRCGCWRCAAGRRPDADGAGGGRVRPPRRAPHVHRRKPGARRNPNGPGRTRTTRSRSAFV